jgi:hypothetical protein
MSTRANIGYKIKSGRNKGKFIFIYSHFDGYLKGLGKTLVHDYNSEELARQLIHEGDCIYPGTCYVQKNKDYNILKPKKVDNIKDTFQQEYSYIWDENKWIYSSNGSDWDEVKSII